MKDFAKSIRTNNKAIYDDKGQFIIGYVEKEGSEYVAYTHGITGAKSFLLKASDEKTATDELKDYAKLYWKKQGNKKVGNEDNSDIIRAAKKQLEYAKKFGWAETGYNGWTKKDVEDLEKKIKELEQKQRTGNDSLITKEGRVNYPDKEIGEINILKRELEGLMRMAQSDKTHDYTKQIEALKKEISEKKNKYAVGNKRYFDVEEEGGDSRSFSSLSEAKRFADEWRKEGKRTIHIFEIEENDKDPDDFRIVRTHNESIDKQTWSMFKGLSKDAEKEVGNAWTSADEKRLDELARKKATHLSDQEWKEFQELIKRSEQASKDFFKKTGNDNTVSEYNAEIQRLTKKAEQLRRMGQGRSAMEVEKQIEKLGKELRELGNKKIGNAGHWDSKKMIYSKWDDEKGRPSDEYARITWLGEGKGGLAVVWRGTSMTGVKYGSNSLEDLRRWAEEKIGNARPKEQLLADVRELTKYIQEHNGQGCEKEKRLLGEAKEELDKNYGIIIGNETAEEKKYGKVMREFFSGELKSSSGEKVTNPEQAKAIAYSESKEVNNLKRARNAMTKNAMGIADLEAQIKKNEEYIKSLQGKTVDSEGWSAKASIQEAQDEIDRMKSRIEELKKQGNKKG